MHAQAPPERKGPVPLAGGNEAGNAVTSDHDAITQSNVVQRFQAIVAAATDPNLCRSDVACLAVILDRFNRVKGYAWPSVDRIANDAAIHRSNVLRAISRLESAAYLVVKRRGIGRSNRYIPTFKTSSAGATSSVGDTSSAGATEAVALALLEPVAPTLPEPSYGTYLENPSKKARDESRSTRFEEFWSAYPRKEGSKAKAKASWARQNLDEQADRIIHEVDARADLDISWQQQHFIPHASTYLNQQRWEDEWSGNQPAPKSAVGRIKAANLRAELREQAEARASLITYEETQ